MDPATKADLDRMLESLVEHLEAMEMRAMASSQMRNDTAPNHVGQGPAGSQDQQRFERLEARLEILEKRRDDINARQGRSEARLAAIEDRLASMEGRLSTLTLRVKQLAARNETRTQRVVAVEGRIEALTPLV